MKEDSTRVERMVKEHGLRLANDGRIDWDEGSKQHPRNWGLLTKSYTTVIVIWLEAYMTAISSAGTATSKEAIKDYGTTSTIGYLCFVTVYLTGQTLGGIFLAPISELFGRRTIYIVGTVSFGISSVITGVPPHLAAATIGRFFQGAAASIPATVAFGNFDDMFNADHRIWVVYAYTLFGMAGLAIGPIYSSYVTELLGWRWVYHISAVISGASAASCFFIRESNATQLLQKRTADIRTETGDDSLEPKVDANRDTKDHSIISFIRTHLLRPLNFLFTEPLVTLCAVLCSIVFSLLYASTESLTIIYTTAPFNTTFTSSTKSSLAFIPILIGEILNVLPRFYDAWFLRTLRKRNKRILPESKIHSFAVACPALAIGLWILAWTVPQQVTNVPWPVSMIGLILIGFAANDFSYVLFGYLTDAYGFYAASAVSAISTARTLAAGIFPLFVTFMYEGIGNNYATTILAVAATIFCFTPWLFITKGEKLRNRSNWASKGDDCLPEENYHMNGHDQIRNKKSGEEEEEGRVMGVDQIAPSKDKDIPSLSPSIPDSPDTNASNDRKRRGKREWIIRNTNSFGDDEGTRSEQTLAYV